MACIASPYPAGFFMSCEIGKNEGKGKGDRLINIAHYCTIF